MSAALTVDYQTSPDHYRHITLSFDGEIATLAINTSVGSEDEAFAGLRQPVRQYLGLAS